jgi:DNA-binding NarL/FixJ family response regulator
MAAGSKTGQTQSMKPTRVLLVDDHALVRAGIRELLQKIGGVVVVAEAGEGPQALALVPSTRPDVMLLDVAMKGLTGLEVTQRMAKLHPDVKVIILSMHANLEYVLHALRSGARGYLLKDAATAELQLALQAVQAGYTYLSPAISSEVVDSYLGRIGAPPSPLAKLTPRQREILEHIAEGRSTKEMAHTLSVSVKTVETHRAQLMARLGIHDVAGLVRFALRAGLIKEA